MPLRSRLLALLLPSRRRARDARVLALVERIVAGEAPGQMVELPPGWRIEFKPPEEGA